MLKWVIISLPKCELNTFNITHTLPSTSNCKCLSRHYSEQNSNFDETVKAFLRAEWMFDTDHILHTHAQLLFGNRKISKPINKSRFYVYSKCFILSKSPLCNVSHRRHGATYVCSLLQSSDLHVRFLISVAHVNIWRINNRTLNTFASHQRKDISIYWTGQTFCPYKCCVSTHTDTDNIMLKHPAIRMEFYAFDLWFLRFNSFIGENPVKYLSHTVCTSDEMPNIVSAGRAKAIQLQCVLKETNLYFQ